MAIERDTEAAIFEAATTVFHAQGLEGARMQEIADRAGINKAMLHYYYKSKRKLFEAVFRFSASRMMPKVVGALTSDAPLLDKIESVVHAYIDVVRTNPHMPAFIIEELRRSPDWLRQFIAEHTGGVFERISEEVERAVANGEIRPIKPAHLLANLIALCVFPFIARPMLQTVTHMDDAAYEAFLEARKQEVTTFIHRALVP